MSEIDIKKLLKDVKTLSKNGKREILEWNELKPIWEDLKVLFTERDNLKRVYHKIYYKNKRQMKRIIKRLGPKFLSRNRYNEFRRQRDYTCNDGYITISHEIKLNSHKLWGMNVNDYEEVDFFGIPRYNTQIEVLEDRQGNLTSDYSVLGFFRKLKSYIDKIQDGITRTKEYNKSVSNIRKVLKEIK